MHIPMRGDIVFIDAEPHAGHEYGGHSTTDQNIRRPMIVLSNNDYNRATGMVIGMVVTSKDFSDNDFYYAFADFESGIKGSVVTWQLPTYDFQARNGEIVGHTSEKLVQELRQRAIAILS
nr:type II toxin-antitoxin system PemK/MazF family toxin [Lentilactobacillus kisonensis]